MSEDREPSLLALYCSMEPVGGDDGDANYDGDGDCDGDDDDDDRGPSLSEAPSEYCSM